MTIALSATQTATSELIEVLLTGRHDLETGCRGGGGGG
jgi:hypothetical protein